MPRALTAWKYGPGRGLSIGVDAQADDTDSGQGEPPAAPRLLAHCGLMFRDVMAFGQPIQAAQLVDLMVAPHARGRLLRHGSPFAKVVGHALAQLGTAVNPQISTSGSGEICLVAAGGTIESEGSITIPPTACKRG